MLLELPQELIDKILILTDFETQVRLYTSKHGLQTIVSPHTFHTIEPAILAYFQTKHQKLLRTCLSCLRYHVFDDGTPVKKMNMHKYVNVLDH